MNFTKILHDIKDIKIQGAEQIALAGIRALQETLHKSKTSSSYALLTELQHDISLLIKSRPTEPCLRNTLKFIIHDLPSTNLKELKESLHQHFLEVIKHFDFSQKIITEIGCQKIKNNHLLFTHCHSSTVANILIAAKKEGKSFIVHNTETRPLLQGRIMAQQLAQHGIKVIHYIDSAARFALKNADLMLIGCDAITSEGKVINKIGSEMFCEMAYKYDVPIYVCTNSWKFDPETIYGVEEDIEERNFREVWKDKPKNVTIVNPAFEKINPDLISGIISELGVYKPNIFVEEVKLNYPWIIK